MTLDSEKIAERLGATFLCQAPLSDGGAFGMAQLAEAMKQRLDPRGGRRRGTAVGWVLSSRVPMKAETEKLLLELAEKLSTPERRISPMELAAHLLEDAVQNMAIEQKP